MLQVKRETLIEALSIVTRALEKKNTMPVLSHVRIQMGKETGTITGTNLETAIIYPIEGNTAKEVDILLPGQKLLEVVKNAQSNEKNIGFEIKDKWAVVNHATIATLPPSEYPKVPEVKGNKVDLPDIAEKLSRVMVAAGESDTRYVLNTVDFDFENKAMVATDGHRLHKIDYDFGIDKDYVLVPIAAARLIKGDKIKAVFGKENGIFYTEKYTLISRFTEGTYPNWQNVIPKEHSLTITAKISTLKELAQECTPLSKDRANAGRITVKEGTLTVEADNPDLGFNKTSMPAELKGTDEIVFGINLRYLLETLGQLENDKVTLFMTDSISPIKIVEKDFLALVMPLRI